MSDDNVEFLHNKTICSLHIQNEALHVTCLKKLNVFNPRPLSAFNKKIPLCDIITVRNFSSERKVNGTEQNPSSSEESGYVLKLDVVMKLKDLRWRVKTLKFETHCETNCNDWCLYINCKLQEYLQKTNCVRPQCLLVFVNPYGGRRKAKSIYKNEISPLFDKAGIKVVLVVTQYRNHARNYIEENDLSTFDGIVAVGGDGMLNELINGVLIRTQKEQNIPLQVLDDYDSESNFSKCNIKLGLIPGGSTNCISYVSQGNDDPVTSALHIIVGDSHPLDVVSVHDVLGTFLRFSFSMTAYGYFGDVLDRSERLRNLGPSRYDFAGVNAFMQLQAYPGEIQFLLSGDVHEPKSRCRYPCSVCVAGADAISIKSQKLNSESSKCVSSATSTSSLALANGVSNPVSDDSNLIIESSGYDKIHDDKPSPCSSSGFGSLHTNAYASLSKGSQPTSDNDVTDKYSNATSEWKVTRGNFVMVNSAVMSCACAKCPLGLSPSAHLSDGSMALIVVRESSRSNFLKYLLSLSGKGGRLDFPFVEVHNVKGFKFRSLSNKVPVSGSSSCLISDPKRKRAKSLPTLEKKSKDLSSCWNSDGELIPEPNIDVWVHRGLISLFARGIEVMI